MLDSGSVSTIGKFRNRATASTARQLDKVLSGRIFLFQCDPRLGRVSLFLWVFSLSSFSCIAKRRGWICLLSFYDLTPSRPDCPPHFGNSKTFFSLFPFFPPFPVLRTNIYTPIDKGRIALPDLMLFQRRGSATKTWHRAQRGTRCLGTHSCASLWLGKRSSRTV